MAGAQLLSVTEMSKHASAEDLWLVIDENVWDMTEFAPSHPGGSGIIMKYAGLDATTAYSEIHAPSVVKDELDPSKLVGKLDKSTVTEEWTKKSTPKETPNLSDRDRPPLETIINLFDFEAVASKTLSKKNWAFYSSGATDNFTRDSNRFMFDRIWWRPRLARDVSTVNTESTILGHKVKMPLFISPSAMAKLIHPEGEKAMAKACVSKGIIQCISNNASFSAADIVEGTPDTHPTFFQLYVNTDRQKTRELLPRVLALRPKIQAIWLTIDAPVPGKREADERLKADESAAELPNSGAKAKNDSKGGGLGRIMGSYIDKALRWDDIPWIREMIGPDMPLVIKGIQSAADAKLALDSGEVQGILVSNHGGRSLDSTPPAVLSLLELHKCCPEVFDKMEVYLDGGVRRGTDILKCLCLGAKAVGIGRHFLYSLEYGQEGVEHLVDLLQDELETSMRLTGITDLSQVGPQYVNTSDVDYLVPDVVDVHPYIKWRPKARI